MYCLKTKPHLLKCCNSRWEQETKGRVFFIKKCYEERKSFQQTVYKYNVETKPPWPSRMFPAAEWHLLISFYHLQWMLGGDSWEFLH